MTTTPPLRPSARRRPLVLASRAVLDAAQPIIGEGRCLESLVAHALERGRGTRHTREGEPRLRPGHLLVRGDAWLAVVQPGPGRLVADPKAAWHVTAVLAA